MCLLGCWFLAEFTIDPKNMAVEVNGHVQFDCAISILDSTLMPPFLTWSFIPQFSSSATLILRDDQVLEEDYVGLVQASAQRVNGSFVVSLTFQDVQFSKAGTYRCSSLHETSSNAFRDAELVVLGKNFFIAVRVLFLFIGNVPSKLCVARAHTGCETSAHKKTWSTHPAKNVVADDFIHVISNLDEFR